jgi:hypothetical protein
VLEKKNSRKLTLLFNKDKNQQKREDNACPTLNAAGWSDGGWGQADARNATCLNASKKKSRTCRGDC